MNENQKNCRCCHRNLPLKPLLQYHNMPKSAQNFPDEFSVDEEQGVDIVIYECCYCGLLQVAGAPVPYYKDVIRATGVSEEMRRFRLKQYENWVEENQLNDKKVIEIGCGKGEYLEVMENTNTQVAGLEHLEDSVEKGRKKGHKIYCGFIENESYSIPGGPYDAFYIMNFLEHIPEPGNFLVGIANNIVSDGVGIVEVPNVNMILEKSLYSEFIQDHLCYFTKETLRNILELNGFEVQSCEEVWYRYIISARVKKRSLTNTDKLKKYMQKMQDDVDKYIVKMEKEKKVIAGWGAGHQALANLSLLNMKNKIHYIIDSAVFKQNKFTPASHIPVVSPDILDEGEIGAVIIMAAGYSDEIKSIMLDKYPEISIAIIRENELEIVK